MKIADGHIRVYTDNKPEPIIDVYDPFVLPVKYMSFSSFQGATNEYLYNCVSDKTTIDNSNDIPKQPVATSTNDLAKVPLDGEFCRSIYLPLLLAQISELKKKNAEVIKRFDRLIKCKFQAWYRNATLKKHTN